MRFVRGIWRVLVGVKDALVLILMLLFFGSSGSTRPAKNLCAAPPARLAPRRKRKDIKCGSCAEFGECWSGSRMRSS